MSATGEDVDLTKTLTRISLRRLTDAFEFADKNVDGKLDADEFASALRSLGEFKDYSDSQLAALWPYMRRGSGSLLDIDEFLAPRAVQEILSEVPNPQKVMPKSYPPTAAFLWRMWRGTSFAATWKTTLASFFVGLLLTIIVRGFTHPTWPLGTLPDPSHPWIAHLLPLASLWEKLLTLTTFVATFSLGQSLSFWRSCSDAACSIASRITDINLLLAGHASRTADGIYTPEAEAVLTNAARNSRLFYILYWADLVKSFHPVRSGAGIKRLCDLGFCTKDELELLLDMPRTMRHHAVLTWLVAQGIAGRDSGAIVEANNSFSHLWMERIYTLRSAYGRIANLLRVRMPLVYLHLVQILVDTLLVIAPFALFAKLGFTSCFLSVFLSTFYRGLVIVSKSFLDPFGNEDEKFEIDVASLVKSCNSASTRFLEAGKVLPKGF